MRDPHIIIIRPLLTEKSTLQAESNKYHFKVKLDANKIEIKQAIEKIFKVKVDRVRTQVRKGKPSRVRFKVGFHPDWKRAVVTLKEGHKIEIGN